MEIAPNIHRLAGFIANQYLLISGDELTLIDAGLPGNHNRILNYIQKIGFKPTSLKHILVTHADGDHSAAVGDLKLATGAIVYASQPEADAIRAGVSSRPLKPHGLQKPIYALSKRIIPTIPNPVDEILTPGLVFPVLEGLQVLNSAGHTPGHLSFYLSTDCILFAGDSIWNSRNGPIPYATTANTWDTNLATESFQRQMALKPKIIAAGHFFSAG
jgi:glyoxylase-like metal-dependent hydrolase (beta-lactamase superfamily II)